MTTILYLSIAAMVACAAVLAWALCKQTKDDDYDSWNDF